MTPFYKEHYEIVAAFGRRKTWVLIKKLPVTINGVTTQASNFLLLAHFCHGKHVHMMEIISYDGRGKCYYCKEMAPKAAIGAKDLLNRTL